jgi:hypothetical protein
MIKNGILQIPTLPESAFFVSQMKHLGSTLPLG